MSLWIDYYYRISIEGDVDISLSLFDRQMKFLSENACVCSLDDVCEFIETGRIPLRPTVAITFDDGFYETYSFAEPIISRYGLIATVFVSTSRIWNGGRRITLRDYWEGKVSLRDFMKPSPVSLKYRDTTSPYKSGFMTWEEARYIDKSSVKVESHGHLHLKLPSYPPRIAGTYKGFAGKSSNRRWWLRHLGYRLKEGMPVFVLESSLRVRTFKWENSLLNFCRLTPDCLEKVKWKKLVVPETEEEQRKRILDELETSKRLIEENLDKRVIHLAWPWGEYSELSVELAKSAGFKACYTTEKRMISRSEDVFHIPRLGARRGWGKFLKRFYACASGYGYNALKILKIGV